MNTEISNTKTKSSKSAAQRLIETADPQRRVEIAQLAVREAHDQLDAAKRLHAADESEENLAAVEAAERNVRGAGLALESRERELKEHKRAAAEAAAAAEVEAQRAELAGCIEQVRKLDKDLELDIAAFIAADQAVAVASAQLLAARDRLAKTISGAAGAHRCALRLGRELGVDVPLPEDVVRDYELMVRVREACAAGREKRGQPHHTRYALVELSKQMQNWLL